MVILEPIMNMEVRSKTQGLASPSISFSHYDISTLKATDIK